MMREKRTALLGHPLCMALVRYKWNKFGRHIYFFLLFLYWLFLAAVTFFTINTPAPYSARQLMAHSKVAANASNPLVQEHVRNILHAYKNEGYGSFESCIAVEQYTGVTKRVVAEISKVAILALAGIHLLKELLQFTRVRFSAQQVMF